MYEQLTNKEKKLAVIGLGYVGLPIALEFARHIDVIGFDINSGRIEKMKKGVDPSNELDSVEFKDRNITYTANPADLKNASFYIVTVPTPIDAHNLPDLKPLLSATQTIGKVLKKGDYIVYESTVYPGCTEEDCIPLLEELSGLKCGADFKVGFSPERINPGDKEHTITKILKVVSGCDDESLETISKVYSIIVKAGIHKAQSIKVAEAAKIIENTQRDVNIALMNELSIIFNKMGINTYDVLAAAGTKWNFIKMMPGLVGGHCIGVDPYYLTYKAQSLGYHAQVINSGRYVNDSMGFYIAKQVAKKIIGVDKDISKSKVLVLGVTFKENVSDIRNSKVADLVKELVSYGLEVDVVDPNADPKEIQHEYGFEMSVNVGSGYDAVIVAVCHKQFMEYDEKYFQSLCNDNSLFVDVKGVFRNKIRNMAYWSL